MAESVYVSHGFAWEKRNPNSGYVEIDYSILKATYGVNAKDLPEGWMIDPNTGLPIETKVFESAEYGHRMAYQEEIKEKMDEGTFELKFEDFDPAMIANTAQNALNGDYLPADSILTQYWEGELHYYVRADGTIRVDAADGTPLGFITTATLLDSYAAKREAEDLENKKKWEEQQKVEAAYAKDAEKYSSRSKGSNPYEDADLPSDKVFNSETKEIEARYDNSTPLGEELPEGKVYDKLNGVIVDVEIWIPNSNIKLPPNQFWDSKEGRIITL